MDTGPAATRPAAVARNSISALVPICCIGFIFFLIAATIVISLIPIYLRSRGSPLNPNNNNNPVGAVPIIVLFRLNNGTLVVGALNANNCAVIQQDQRNFAASNNNVAPSVPTVVQCTVTGNTTRRRRQSQAPVGNLITINELVIGTDDCPEGDCLTARAQSFMALLLTRGSFTLLFTLDDGTQVVFSVTIIAAIVETPSSSTPVIINASPPSSLPASTPVIINASPPSSPPASTPVITNVSPTSPVAVIIPTSSSGILPSTAAATNGPITPSITTSTTQNVLAANNDIAILNYALTLEHLEANFYTTYQARFTAQDFIDAGYTQQAYDYFNIIYVHELAHVRALIAIITQLNGNPVPKCVYNFAAVTDVKSYITVAIALENTGAMAYDGAVNGISDPTLRQTAATVATVEARHASYLNSLGNISPFPTPFENATVPSVIIAAIQPFIISCPFTITAPIVPYVGSSSFTGTVPVSNNPVVSPYTNDMYINDMKVLNYALVAEHLESFFYNTYVSQFSSSDFTNNGFPDATSFYIMIREIEKAHVQFLELTITQRGGTPVAVCTYNFSIGGVQDFVSFSSILENTGAKAYAGAIGGISDPNLILGAATIATVEARFASYLNRLNGLVPFPDVIDPTLTPQQVVAALSAHQVCSFPIDLPTIPVAAAPTPPPPPPQTVSPTDNDIAILNYALTLEHLEAYFYTTYQANFTAQDFIDAGFTQQTFDYFNIIYVHELAHVRALTEIITQLNATAVPECVYNFAVVTDVKSYVTVAQALENTGAMAYDGAINGIADPTLRQIAATVATVEARHASFLNSLSNQRPSPTPFENATVPSVIIAAIQPFIISCPYTITAPIVPFVGSSSFSGIVPFSNDTTVTPYTNAMYVNDMKALNYFLVGERFGAAFYNTYVTQFSSSDFTNNGFADATSYFIMIKEIAKAHVQLLEITIAQRGGTAVAPCTYNFTIPDVQAFVDFSVAVQNAGVSAYNGGIGTLSDPSLILTIMTISTVEARFASTLNGVDGLVPFPNVTDPAVPPFVVAYELSTSETCPFTLDPPIVLPGSAPSPLQGLLAGNNDIAILNYALTLEHLEAYFYTTYQAKFTAQDFIAAGFTQQTYDYFNIIYVHELAHVRALTDIITQLGGDPVPECVYNFAVVTDVKSYVTTARALENTGTMAYDGAANGISDPTLRQTAATVATVEARHASYLNSLENISPFPTPFENATVPSVVIAAIQPFIVSCPYIIIPPIVPYIGSSSFNGTVPVSNNPVVSPYTNDMYINDMKVLNYALVAEHLESFFYNTYVSQFSSSDFTNNGFPDATSFYIMIREIEKAHVQFLELTITQRGGTPVAVCTYNFSIGGVQDFVSFSSILENTGAKAYAGAIGGISDPNLILGAATIATVEARFASYLNRLNGLVPFPDVIDPTLTPQQVVAALSAHQVCPFSPDLPTIPVAVVSTTTPLPSQNLTPLNNDIAILNYALTLEHLEAYFYTTYQAKFTAQDFIAAGFTQQTFDYFNIIYVHELAHVRALTGIITQLNGTAVPECVYNFAVVADVKSYVTVAQALENTGAMAYDGAINGIADPTLRQIAATVATVEARHASFLNSLSNQRPSPKPFENATVPSVIIAAIQPFIKSCPYTITAPIVPFVGSSSFSGTVPLSNDTTVTPYTKAMYVNDMKALNYFLVGERFGAAFYNKYVSQFSSSDFTNNGFADATSIFIMIKEITKAHVQLLEITIAQRGGTAVAPCTYNFTIPDVQTFVDFAVTNQNAGVAAYNGAIGTLSDPSLILTIMTLSTVEARFASTLNGVDGLVPFPNVTDPAVPPFVVANDLSTFQTCPFTLDPPIVLPGGAPSPLQGLLAANNDIAILNYALTLEHLEANFYTIYQARFTAQDFINAGYTQQTYDYFNIIYVHELAHVRALTAIITQLNATAVPKCVYNFAAVTDVKSYITIARALENTGAMAYDGAVNGISDPTLRQTAATVATVEARHASYLNFLGNLSVTLAPFENATVPSVIIAAIQPFIISCPYTIIPPTVPYIGSSSFNGTKPVSNDPLVSPYTNDMYLNDMKILNYILVTEHSESYFYNTYVSQFSSSDFINNGFRDATSFYIMIREIEKAHVQFLELTITQRGGTPVAVCTYNYTIASVQDFVGQSSSIENRRVRIYDGAIGGLRDPTLILAAATIATVEARFASYVNVLNRLLPFPDVTDPTQTPQQVIATLGAHQVCSFSIDVPTIPVAAAPTPPPTPSPNVLPKDNDIAILNYALTLEHLEANFYTIYQARFTAQDFINAGFTQQTYDYFNIIYVHELAHVRALTGIITQLNGTAVPKCVYNFGVVTDVKSYVATARALENTGTMAYDGAINGIADPTLRQISATVATVEARHASYLNKLGNLRPSPTPSENATVPSVVIAAIQPFITSCPYTITAPIVPFVGSSSFSGTTPFSNDTTVTPYTNAMYVNDLKALNYFLVGELFEAAFYNKYVSQFSSSDFTNNGFADLTASFIMIREITNAHVQLLDLAINQRVGTPVFPCTYNFTIPNVQAFVDFSVTIQNAGVSAYDGAIGTLSDPSLILTIMTIATVEARFASTLNGLDGLVPFPNATDPAIPPFAVVAELARFQTCPFAIPVPVILNPSGFVPQS